MRTYEAVADFLQQQGIDTVFTLQSDGNMQMLAHIHGERSDEMRLVKARHEQAAVAMADGYSRVSDDVPLCTVGRGPAIAQSGTGLVTAQRHGSDFLLLVPESSTDATFDIKGFDQEQYLDNTVENVLSARSTGTVLPKLRDGLRQVKVGDGPVAVQVARNVLEGSLDEADVGTGGLDLGEGLAAQVRPDDERIEEAVELFLESDATKAPVILAGRGAVRGDARDAVATLAERMNAMLVTTLQGRGFFGDHPYAAGFVGHYGSDIANEYVMESDYVLAVGCSLNPYTTDEEHLFPDDPKVVHVDADPSAIEQYMPVDVGIVGDARATVEAIERELDRRGIDRAGEFWTESVRERIADAPDLDQHEFPDHPGTVDPRDLLGELNRILPDERTVVSDTGHHTRWVLDGIETPTPEDFVWPSEFGSIGLGVPVGIGAALGADDRTCVTFCGDAGFMMTDHEIETAARNDVPIIVVVMNDRALGTEYHSLDRYTDNADVSIIGTPNIADVAEAMGAEGYTVQSTEDVADLEDELDQQPSGPVVLDCLVNRDVIHRSKM